VEGFPRQVDAILTAALQQRLQGEPVSAQQQTIDAMRTKMAQITAQNQAKNTD